MMRAPVYELGRVTADLVVLTVLPEEYGAVLECLHKPELIRGSATAPNTCAWRLGLINAGHYGAPFRIAVGMGTPTTTFGALAASQAIGLFDPRYVAFVGVAGGFDQDGQRHGDVAVSSVVTAYEYGKVDTGGFAPRGNFTYRCNEALVRATDAARATGARWWRDDDNPASPPSVRTGMIASGDKLIDDPDEAFFAAVRAAWPKLLAVEMEGAGVAAAVHEVQGHRAVGFILVRGISDMPHRKASGAPASTQERDGWKVTASRNAARFLAHLIATAWPSPPRDADFAASDQATGTARMPAIASEHAAATPRVPPTPAYPNAEVQALSERVRDAQTRRQALRDAGVATDEIDREILQLRRQLREGGQLHAGDNLGDGRYLLIKQIGRGGFAVVWQAYDKVEKQEVAVKVLHANLAGDPQRRERFFRGARVMVRLAHPAVVRVLDPRGEDGGFCYFVMELMSGGNLRDAVIAKRIDKANVLPLIVQVGEALAKAHSIRVIHRDVKPSNILLDGRGNAKLTDFDLVGAHDTTGGTRSGALGTVVYAAPECLDRPQDATARADVFGLGMTMTFCLLEQELTIFTFRDPKSTIAKVDCSADVRNLLERAVTWEVDQRFEDAAAMLVALRRVLPPQTGTSAQREPTADRDGAGRESLSAASDDVSGEKRLATLRFLSGKYTGGEFKLCTNQQIIIGRNTDLDMVLIENMVSRRHAMVISTDTSIYIEDMGSVNGTFVNGERIKARTLLHDHDRVLVGTSIFKVFTVEGQFAQQREAEARRLLIASAHQRQATQLLSMAGMIDEIPLPDLLGLLSRSRKSGVLTIRNDTSVGKIYLREGALYFATINDGFEASPRKWIYRLLGWATGRFELESGVEVVVTEEITEPIEVLLMEGLRHLEEFRNLQAQMPQLDSALVVPSPVASKLRELTPAELDAFQLVLDHGQLQKVLDSFPGTDLEAAHTVIRLMKRELVIDARESSQRVGRRGMPAIPESTRALVIERLQQLHEFRNLQKQLPLLSAALAVPIPLAGLLRTLTPSELDTFQLVLDHGEVQKVLGSSPERALDTARNIVRLIQSDFVVVP
jgi:serine/threonine protein kinase/nucleoside phosphorylase